MSAGKQKRGSISEAALEHYFVEQVEKHGGIAEKFTSPGRRHVPDRIVTWPCYGFARVHFVELKTIGGKLELGQIRDHARRRHLGCHVRVVWTKKQVDEYVAEYRAT
jgi:uncharacterized OB-fold protein